MGRRSLPALLAVALLTAGCLGSPGEGGSDDRSLSSQSVVEEADGWTLTNTSEGNWSWMVGTPPTRPDRHTHVRDGPNGARQETVGNESSLTLVVSWRASHPTRMSLHVWAPDPSDAAWVLTSAPTDSSVFTFHALPEAYPPGEWWFGLNPWGPAVDVTWNATWTLTYPADPSTPP